MMTRKGFTLIELLIVVAIIAILVGVALPYYQNYVREARITKAKHELDIIKEALIKYNTFEDKKFSYTDLNVLQGNYLQQLTFDPWGRAYEVQPGSGTIKSLGPDHQDPRDDIVVDYLPALSLNKATWVDADHNRHITQNDLLRLEFTRFLQPIATGGILFGGGVASTPADSTDLLFSNDVDTTDFISDGLTGSSTELWLRMGATADDTTFFPGSSTVRVASGNVHLQDFANRLANGTKGQFPGLEVLIKAD
ncbi:MAG: prepilin-type N-terminal cleavage/methylation domain-containing protein [Candidatus Riflebacteria bacterium]|nr:prepilin-type N-terminal cleavage/methylation domain-containing protein [Candidatus Riflebacteria bacterium]